MLPCEDAVASVAVSALSGTSYATLSAFEALQADQTLARRFLVIASPYDPDAAAVIPLRYAEGSWEPTFDENDSASPVRVVEAINYESTVFSGDRIAVGSAASFGDIRVVVNPEAGDTDDFIDYSWNGRVVETLLGGDDFDLSEFQVVQSAVAAGEPLADLGGFKIQLQDPSLKLNDPIQDSRYAGTGQIEGDADLEDQLRPVCFGSPKNITPRVIDQTNNVVQFHDRDVKSVLAAYDQGVALTPNNGGSNDITDLALASVWAWSPTGGDSGTYITDLAQGLVRTADPTAGLLTLDVEGDYESSVFAATIPDIVDRILRQRASYTDASFDLPSFAKLTLNNTQAASLYLPEGSASIIQVVTDLLDDLLAFWRFNQTGEFAVGQIRTETPSRVIPQERVHKLQNIASPRPHKRRTLRYDESNTVQDKDSLAGAATDAHAAFVGQQWRTVTELNATTESVDLGALEDTIDTHLDDQTEATTELSRQLAILSQRNRVWQAEITRHQFYFAPGDTVRVEYPRFGFDSGHNFIVLGVVERSETLRTRLTLFG